MENQYQADPEYHPRRVLLASRVDPVVQAVQAGMACMVVVSGLRKAPPVACLAYRVFLKPQKSSSISAVHANLEIFTWRSGLSGLSWLPRWTSRARRTRQAASFATRIRQWCPVLITTTSSRSSTSSLAPRSIIGRRGHDHRYLVWHILQIGYFRPDIFG